MDPALEAKLARLQRQEAILAKRQARAAKERELLDMVHTSNLLFMPEDKRGRLRAGLMRDVAGLRLENGDITGATEAIKLALESAAWANDPSLLPELRAMQVLILHYGALSSARQGDLKKALAYFDRAMELPALTADQRRVLGGDRLQLMEAQGSGDSSALALAALGRLLGPTEAPKPAPPPVAAPSPSPAPVAAVKAPELPPLPTAPEAHVAKPVQQKEGGFDPFDLDADKIRAAINRDLGKDVAESQLPSAGNKVPTESGKFDAASVVRVVSANKASISACYSQALRGGATERGKLELLVKVEPTGSVQSAKIVTAQFKTSALGRCIADTVARWRFPSFDGDPRDVELPFVLDYLN